jgi:ribosomal protein S12 methylthiotransferase accessory factor YcaO
VSALPEDFAERLAGLLEPSERDAAAEIIQAATMLDDVGLRRFLQLFAARVRASADPIRAEELRSFLQRAAT